jgi:hypothetical protein
LQCATAQALADVGLVRVIRFVAIAENVMVNARQLKHTLVRLAKRGCFTNPL